MTKKILLLVLAAMAVGCSVETESFESATPTGQHSEPVQPACGLVAECVRDGGADYCRDRFPTMTEDGFEIAVEAANYCDNECASLSGYCMTSACTEEMCD